MPRNHEDGMKGTASSYRVIYLPYLEFSQTCCRLWTGMLFGKKKKMEEAEKSRGREGARYQ